MRNASGSSCCSRVAAPLHAQVLGSPSLLHALASLNVLLLVAYLILFLLAKLAAGLHRRGHGSCDEHQVTETSGREEFAGADDIAGVQQQQAEMLFWFDEAVFEDTALLGGEGKDQLMYDAATTPPTPTPARCLQVESTFPMVESTRRISPHHRQCSFSHEEPKAAATASSQKDIIPAAVPSPENVPVEAGEEDGHGEHGEEDDEEEKRFRGDDVKLFVNSRALADTKKLLLEGAMAGKGGVQREREEESRLGASTLTSESTSKSSVEWRSSTVTKDSETEYPFSSSSRRSSSRWESYALFRKYDEDMVYFHRVGAQKLTETESYRSIKYQPRSVSERIVQKLTPKPRPAIGLRDPYPELERVYVAQICLTWEALNWNYASFRRHAGDIAARCCPARVAQEFQQFQVLLHRFIENEPYEYGLRPEVYARMKNSSPKLLLVPEFRDEEDEKDDLISAVQFLYILEESIRTFMAFLRADKRSHYQMFREMVKRRTSSMDQTLVITLKKANKKKKSRLKDLTRPRRCLRRTKLREEEEMSILLGLIDLKIVARVLRMPEITDQQLHWCEEKMNRVKVDPAQGKMQRDPSPLFFPAH